jgi:hypothetical protein
MGTSALRSFASLSTLAAIALALAACSKSAPLDAAGDAGPADAAAAPSQPGTASPGAAALESPKAPAGAKRIQVALKDVQLFHPFSQDRAMPSLKDDGTVNTRESRQSFGVGVVLEATNETGELLSGGWFEGAVRFIGQDGQESVCDFVEINWDSRRERTYMTVGSRFLSYAPRPPMKVDALAAAPLGPQTDWKDESDSLAESPWRPSERLRMLARKNDCELPLLGDMGVTAIRGRVVVKARRRFVEAYGYELNADKFDMALDGDFIRVRNKASSRVYVVSVNDVSEMRGDDVASRPMPLQYVKLERNYRMTDADLVESDPVEFEIHPRALTLQLVKLPTGEIEHASGNVVIRQKEGKVVFEEMARLKMSHLGVERSDVPGTPPEVSFEADELSGRVASVSLVPSAEDASLAKGQRKLQVTWKLSLKADLIETRLRAPLDAATSALENAQRAAEAAEADASAEAPAVAKAKADLAAAKAAKTAAETKYKTGLGSERGKLAKLFPCGDVKLATNKAVRSPVNGKAAGDACKALDKENEVEVTLTYTLDRYELPVALAYSLGKSPAFRPIASEPLLKLDPR